MIRLYVILISWWSQDNTIEIDHRTLFFGVQIKYSFLVQLLKLYMHHPLQPNVRWALFCYWLLYFLNRTEHSATITCLINRYHVSTMLSGDYFINLISYLILLIRDFFSCTSAPLHQQTAANMSRIGSDGFHPYDKQTKR